LSLKGGFDPERYKAWRATIPWTDEEIAAQIEKNADAIVAANPNHNAYAITVLRQRAARVRLGRVSSRDISEVIGSLASECFCGKKSLYRWGFHGRCSDHRMIKSEWQVEKEKLFRARSESITSDRLAHDNHTLRDQRRINRFQHGGIAVHRVFIRGVKP
jgi:hypothetical protein